MKSFVLPDWFYLPKDPVIRSSTTAGNFDATRALSSTEAWVSTIGQSSALQKKKILIADYTIKQEKVDVLILKQFVVELLQDGFEVFISNESGPKQISMDTLSAIDFYNITPIPQKHLREQMVGKGVSSDELLVLDARLMGHLVIECPEQNKQLYSHVSGPNNIPISVILQPATAYPLVTSSSDPLHEVIDTLESSASIELSYLDFIRYKELPLEKRKKISNIIITDWFVFGNYYKLREIFPSLEKIYASVELVAGFYQFAQNRHSDSPKIMFYCSNPGVNISSENRALMARMGAELIDLTSLKEHDVDVLLNISKEGLDKITANSSEVKKLDITCDYSRKQTLPQVPTEVVVLPKLTSFALRNVNINIDILTQWLHIAPQLQEIYLNDCPGVEGVCLVSGSLPTLKKLQLGSNNPTSIHLMKFLEACPNLQDISLDNGNVTELPTLTPRSLPELIKLNFHSVTINSEVFSNLLDACPDLREINLYGCKGLEYFILNSRLSKLTKLNLGNNAFISINLMKFLEQCPNLQDISLYNGNVTELPTLTPGSLPELIKLNFHDVTITTASLINLLNACPNLREITLNGCKGIESLPLTHGSLSKLTKLKFLNLKPIDITGFLGACPNLQDILLNNCNVTESFTLTPRSLPELIKLNFSGVTITTASLINLLDACPNLMEINLSGCKGIESLSLSHGSLSKLTKLNIDNTQLPCMMETKGMGALNLMSFLGACPNLQDITLNNCNITEPLNFTPGSLPELIKLNFSGVTITTTSLINLLNACPNLREINLSGCKGIESLPLGHHGLLKLTKINISNLLASANLMEFFSVCPKLQYISLNNCNVTESFTLTPGSLPELIKLNFSSGTINPDNLINLLSACPNLREINLNSCNGIESLPLSHGCLSRVTTVDFSSIRTPVDLMGLCSACPKLQNIRLYDCNVAEQLTLMSNSLPELVNIDLLQADISAAALRNLLTAAPNIVRLNLNGIKKIRLTPDLFASMQLSSLQYIELDPSESENEALISCIKSMAPNLVEIKFGYKSTFNVGSVRLDSGAGQGQILDTDDLLSSLTQGSMGDEDDILSSVGQALPTTEPQTMTLNKNVTEQRGVLPSGMMCSNPNAGMVRCNQTLDSNTSSELSSLSACTGAIVPLANPIGFKHARENVYTIEVNNDDPAIKQKEILPNSFTSVGVQPKIVTEGDFDTARALIEECEQNGSSLYEITQQFTMQPGKKYKLMLVTANDALREFKIIPNSLGIDVGKLRLERCQDDSFYYISTDKPCAFTAKFYTTTKPLPLESTSSALDQLIEYFQSFAIPAEGQGALDGITASSSGRERVDAIYNQRKGACRHRVGAFLHKFEELKVKGNIPKNFQARGVGGAVHAWIEISNDNGQTWHIKDLGGYPARLQISEVKRDLLTTRLHAQVRQHQRRARQAPEDIHLAAPLGRGMQLPSVATIAGAKAAEEFLAPQFATTSVKALDVSPVELLDSIWQEGARILLEVANDSSLEKMRQLILLDALRRKKPTFTVDDQSDLLSTRASVRVPSLANSEWDIRNSGNGFSDFMFSNPTESLLVVDWSKFTAAQMVSVNGLLDDHHREVDGVTVPDSAVVVGLTAPPSKPTAPDFMTDPSFTSRHNKIIKVPFTEEQLDKAIAELQKAGSSASVGLESVSSASSSVIIDLYDSPNWKNILFGLCTVNGDQREWRKTPFIAALEEGRPIVIRNGLWHDYQFIRCISDLQLTGTVRCHNQVVLAKKPVIIDRIEGYDFKKLTTCVAKVDLGVTTMSLSSREQDSVFVISSATLERCFINERVFEDKLIRDKGLLEAHKEKDLTLLISDELNLQQWTYLLEMAAKHQVRLRLQLSPNIALPEQIAAHILPALITRNLPLVKQPSKELSSSMPIAGQSLCFTSNDPECLSVSLSQQLMSSKANVYVLDITELNDEDLLYSYGFAKDAEHKFKFHEKISEIWQKLRDDPSATVILKGDFSASLLGHLGGLFLQPGSLFRDGKKELLSGRLILVSAPNPAFSFIGQQEDISISPQVKMVTLLREKEFVSMSEEDVKDLFFDSAEHFATLLEQPYANIKQALKHAQVMVGINSGRKPTIKEALAGKYSVAAIVEQEPLDLSAEACSSFANMRTQAVDVVLQKLPICVLESVAGTGKSNFIREYSLAKEKRKIFYQKDIGEWIKDKDVQDGEERILFIDEANLVKTSWMQFVGLYDNPPTICINGVIHNVPPGCKVIFAQNPASYGGGREIPKLFAQHPVSVAFPPMSAAYMYRNILLPILKQKFVREEGCEIIARNIFKKYRLTDLHNPEKSGVTARVLQLDALKYCATSEAAETLLAKMHKQEIEKVYHVTSNGTHGRQDATRYVLTPSRQEIQLHLHDLVRVRAFRRSLPTVRSHSDSDAQEKARNREALASTLYGGQNAILLEGAPGVGKSELIKYLLEQYNFTAIDTKNLSSVAQSTTDDKYCFIPASMDIDKKLDLLNYAFHEGLLVVCEEINSSSVLEKYVNSYLMGEDINGQRPRKPGFMLVGTYNSASLSGRALLSPALKSRAIALTLPEYNKEELSVILQNKYRSLPADFLQFIITQFLMQQEKARIDVTLPMPTCRDLFNKTKQYVDSLEQVTIASVREHIELFCMSEGERASILQTKKRVAAAQQEGSASQSSSLSAFARRNDSGSQIQSNGESSKPTSGSSPI